MVRRAGYGGTRRVVAASMVPRGTAREMSEELKAEQPPKQLQRSHPRCCHG